MQKIGLLYFTFFAVSLFISCSGNSVGKKNPRAQNNDSSPAPSVQADKSYMFTGFYFLTEDEGNGIKMRNTSSNDLYLLEKTPFASVVNVKKTELRTVKLEQGDYTELCLVFDSKGTKDIEGGTGNP